MEVIRRVQTAARMSQAVMAPSGRTCYLAGQVATNRLLGTREQTVEVLAKIDALLAQCRSSKEHLLSAQVWLADMADFDVMNQVWDAWVPAGQTPARACVQAAMAKPDIRVEIQVVAWCPPALNSLRIF